MHSWRCAMWVTKYSYVWDDSNQKIMKDTPNSRDHKRCKLSQRIINCGRRSKCAEPARKVNCACSAYLDRQSFCQVFRRFRLSGARRTLGSATQVQVESAHECAIASICKGRDDQPDDAKAWRKACSVEGCTNRSRVDRPSARLMSLRLHCNFGLPRNKKKTGYINR